MFLRSTAVQYMIQTSQKNGYLVAHFFYSHSNKSRLKAAHLFRSYIKQIFVPLSELLPSTVYVVDGLDECELEAVHKVLKPSRKMMSQHSTRVYISGREAL